MNEGVENVPMDSGARCASSATRARRAAIGFAEAEAELRRVHAREAARWLACFARMRVGALPLGGVASLWRDPRRDGAVAAAREELHYARRDAAAREPLLERCVALPRRAWPTARELAGAALERRAGVDERLTRALVRFARTGRPGREPVRVLLTCTRSRPRALAFALLGFGALASGDAAGARAHFEAARRARPADARLAWLALALESDSGTPAHVGSSRLRAAFEAARLRGLRSTRRVRTAGSAPRSDPRRAGPAVPPASEESSGARDAEERS